MKISQYLKEEIRPSTKRKLSIYKTRNDKFIKKLKSIKQKISNEEGLELLNQVNKLHAPLTAAWGKDQKYIAAEKNRLAKEYDDFWQRQDKILD